MPPAIQPSTRDAVARVAVATPELDLLLLYGSRGRGDHRSEADWDFGYLAGPALDAATLHAALVEAVGSDRIDLADLGGASGLLRYRAARDGLLLYEARSGLDERFRLDAARFWCDAAPVLRHGYEEVLAALGPGPSGP